MTGTLITVMDINTLPIKLSYSGPPPNRSGRRPRTQAVSLLVVHTNEATTESSTGAEGLAQYTALPHPPDYPAYHIVVDNDSAIRTAFNFEKVNGAGGVNERAVHVCLFGTAHQSTEQWHDPYSRAELILAADLTKQLCAQTGVPMTKITAAQVGAGHHGICAHGDVAQVYKASDGHTDPGPYFPWTEFMHLLTSPAPTPEQVEAYLRLLEEADVEHGMAVDIVVNPDDPNSGYTLDRWGGVHPFGAAKKTDSTAYWSGLDAARRLTITDWSKPAGYVMDLDGGIHPFGGNTRPTNNAYWKGGKLVPIAEI